MLQENGVRLVGADRRALTLKTSKSSSTISLVDAAGFLLIFVFLRLGVFCVCWFLVYVVYVCLRACMRGLCVYVRYLRVYRKKKEEKRMHMVCMCVGMFLCVCRTNANLCCSLQHNVSIVFAVVSCLNASSPQNLVSPNKTVNVT